MSNFPGAVQQRTCDDDKLDIKVLSRYGKAPCAKHAAFTYFMYQSLKCMHKDD